MSIDEWMLLSIDKVLLMSIDIRDKGASVGHKICSSRILASPSIDTKGAPSIDSPSSPRHLPLARQTDYSSVIHA
ncbi:hypothetical protein DY000_02016117 [Brassica cretica]|uniref:Uncharacterized protein n=1 Tax=Brassica cretica TaxID=69181 RepID=A0ABQ7DB73_BRACR|nr:hypothetical protein DY000_02016117 [Brassica cretica]